ncbi:pyridoxamine 5'-phosphate oxidase family protein [Candidatus Acetothermia bacterium]|nr:pyridoxamine 5'-phosphate oxidase family protein [Candidatus Acetothermia bacterium]MBI3643323.1 pyridoxamine 5'-phosphate oxidase family protein [Candidatus Acetothermia bacterium]
MSDKKHPTEREIRDQIHLFLENTRVLTLATCAGNQPWSATLAFAFDKEMNLYCITNGQSRHIQEIVKNPAVSVSMYEHQSPSYNPLTVKGLQLEGLAKILAGAEVLLGLKVFIGRFPKAEKMSVERLFELKSARLLRIEPSRLYYLDRGNFGERVELPVNQ